MDLFSTTTSSSLVHCHVGLQSAGITFHRYIEVCALCARAWRLNISSATISIELQIVFVVVGCCCCCFSQSSVVRHIRLYVYTFGFQCSQDKPSKIIHLYSMRARTMFQIVAETHSRTHTDTHLQIVRTSQLKYKQTKFLLWEILCAFRVPATAACVWLLLLLLLFVHWKSASLHIIVTIV